MVHGETLLQSHNIDLVAVLCTGDFGGDPPFRGPIIGNSHFSAFLCTKSVDKILQAVLKSGPVELQSRKRLLVMQFLCISML